MPSATSLPIFSSTRSGLKLQSDYYNGNELANSGEYRAVPEGFFVYRHMSDDGTFKFNINRTGQKIAVSKEYPVFTTRALDPEFLLHKLNDTRDAESLAQQHKKGGTRTRLYLSALGSWKSSFPSRLEQQKIGSCLASIDELIAVEGQKLRNLKALKKGLLLQLFPAEGKTIPRLRFTEFTGRSEWSIKPLGELGKNLDYRRIPITASERVSGQVPYYGASGIIGFVEGFLFDEDLLCISEDGANLVARTSPIAFTIRGKSWVNNHAHVLKFESRGVQQLVQDYLNSITLKDFLTGMAQPKLNRAMLDTIPIPYPEDKDEREELAGCLSSADELISGQSHKVHALKTHKKGLIQQLFPVLDEAQA